MNKKKYIKEDMDYGKDALQYVNYKGDNWKEDRRNVKHHYVERNIKDV